MVLWQTLVTAALMQGSKILIAYAIQLEFPETGVPDLVRISSMCRMNGSQEAESGTR